MKHIIINVGRQLGSGGHDIGRMLALDFQAKYYDREILNLAAKESGFSERFFAQNDERKGFLRSLFNIQTPHLGGDGSMYRSNNTQDSLFQFQSDAMKKAAAIESCVFVGRCADYILRDQPNLVTLFITAPLEFRVRQVMVKEGIDETQALKKIQQGEEQRATYYNYYTGKKWGHATGYDLCIDSSILGLSATEKLIADYIRKRFNM